MAKILLVEDDADNREMLRRRLERADYEVALAEDGHKAIKQVQRDHPDLVLMDIRLPGQNGYEATRQIRRLPGKIADVPILALTAHALPEDKDQVLEAGCDDYHAKPVDFSELLEQMEALLSG